MQMPSEVGQSLNLMLGGGLLQEHIQNGLFDLFSLILAFLQLDPLSIKRYWQGLLQPLADGDENLLQVISCC
jgi:hypothetical protein